MDRHEQPPPLKRKAGIKISFSELQSLSYAVSHFPSQIPKRWHLVAEYVHKEASRASTPCDSTMLFEINGPAERKFESTHSDCQFVFDLLKDDLPEVPKYANPFYSNTDSAGFMSVVLLPSVSQCCGHNLLIRNRPSHTRVYTTHGTEVGALFSGECRMCKTRYMYSFYEKPHGPSGDAERFYLPPLERQYFQLSSKTVFSVELFHEVTLNLEISWASFESRAKVYNARFGQRDAIKLEEIVHHFRLSDTEKPWLMNDQRLEETWFLFTIVNYYHQREQQSAVKFDAKHFSVSANSSHRIDIEGLCEKVCQAISDDKNPWIEHSCDVKGCKEGYVTIDGLEKVSRTICAAPRERLKLPPGLPNIIQCCHNTPALGGKHSSASKFCKEHQMLQKTTTTNTSTSTTSIASSSATHLPTSQTSTSFMHQHVSATNLGDLPDNDNSTLLTGCKKQVNKYHNRTAGIFAAVRPCGVVVNFMEMYTCESPTQAYVFLWLTFGRSLEELKCLKYCGYDRACDLHPFVQRMKRNGGLGQGVPVLEISDPNPIFQIAPLPTHPLRHIAYYNDIHNQNLNIMYAYDNTHKH